MMHSTQRKHLIPILIAFLATVPGVYLFLSGLGKHLLETPQAYWVAIISGVAVLGASFLLLWACDAVQEDISQTLALAIVALIAVLPEYAVDMYITWQAAKDPAYEHYAIANMTGANRLIIGVAWLVVVGIYWLKTRKAVRIEKDRRTELFFLALATVYAFVIPLKGSLEWYDGLVFVGIYVWYIRVAGRRPVAESAAEGPAELLLSLPVVQRRMATIGMFLVAAGAILCNAEQFSEGLLETGGLLKIDKALLIQWLAPIASEAPEFTVAVMFALRRRAGLALGSLLSAKLNQWTLLVGMIPWVYGFSLGNFKHPMPLGHFQRTEILITAAQSLLAIVILSVLRITIWEALLIFALFVGQFVSPPDIHQWFTYAYLAATVVFMIIKPSRLNQLWKGVRLDEPSAEAKPVEVHSQR